MELSLRARRGTVHLVRKETYGTSPIKSKTAPGRTGWHRGIVDRGSTAVLGIHRDTAQHCGSDTNMFRAG